MCLPKKSSQLRDPSESHPSPAAIPLVAKCTEVMLWTVSYVGGYHEVKQNNPHCHISPTLAVHHNSSTIMTDKYHDMSTHAHIRNPPHLTTRAENCNQPTKTPSHRPSQTNYNHSLRWRSLDACCVGSRRLQSHQAASHSERARNTNIETKMPLLWTLRR